MKKEYPKSVMESQALLYATILISEDWSQIHLAVESISLSSLAIHNIATYMIIAQQREYF